MGNSVTAAVPFLVQGVGKTNAFQDDNNKVLVRLFFLFFFSFSFFPPHFEGIDERRQDGRPGLV